MHLWPERVVPKCAEDRSLAIAHGLEDVFWVQDDDNPDKWHPRHTPTTPIDQLIAERTNPTTTAARQPPHTMTDTFHAYVANQLATQLKQRRIVVWYDARSEFAPFVERARRATATDATPIEVDVAGTSAHLVVDDGSLYSHAVPGRAARRCGRARLVVVYLPGRQADPRRVGADGARDWPVDAWEPQLRQLARNALRQRFTDGVIDELLGRESTTYADIAAALGSEGTKPPSVLKSILSGGSSDAQIAAWLATIDARRGDRREGGGRRAPQAGRDRGWASTSRATTSSKWRRIVVRTALGLEFRSDLGG